MEVLGEDVELSNTHSAHVKYAFETHLGQKKTAMEILSTFLFDRRHLVMRSERCAVQN